MVTGIFPACFLQARWHRERAAHVNAFTSGCPRGGDAFPSHCPGVKTEAK